MKDASLSRFVYCCVQDFECVFTDFWKNIRAFNSGDHQNLELVKIFLDAGLKGEQIHDALKKQSQFGDDGLPICSLLLSHGASVDEYEGEALNRAVCLVARCHVWRPA